MSGYAIPVGLPRRRRIVTPAEWLREKVEEQRRAREAEIALAVAYRTGSARSDNFANASPVVTKGTNIVDGDAIILGFATDTTHTRGAATLNGFTDHGVVNDGTNGSLTLLTKVASGEPASWTFTNLFAASESGICGQAAYSGVDGSNRFSAGPTSGTGTGAGEQLTPSITPAVNDSMIVDVRGSDPAANPRTWTDDASPDATERLDAQNALLGFIYIQDFLQTTAAAVQLGATPNASETSAIWVMALRPATAAAQRAARSRRCAPRGGTLPRWARYTR